MAEERPEEDIGELREQLAQLRLLVARLIAILQEKGLLCFADILDLRMRIEQDREQLDRELGKPLGMPWWPPNEPAD